MEAVEILKQAKVQDPWRLLRLMEEAIRFLDLDLSGLTVLTEAASGPYAAMPLIAALAGANQVLALTRDSRYASGEEVIRQTRALEALAGREGFTRILTERSMGLFASADIVTNSGFVRPVDREAVTAMKPTAVVPLMFEAWEFRAEDVDLEACHRKGIPVMGTFEEYPGLNVFTYCGHLCLKLLFEAQIEVFKSRILVVSRDSFGPVIQERLSSAGADARLAPSLAELEEDLFAGLDAIVVADYRAEGEIIGENGTLPPAELARLAPACAVIQFAGPVDVAGLKRHGIRVFPGEPLSPHRMARTLADLGPRPGIELNAAGFKVGELMARNRSRCADVVEFERWLAGKYPLCQVVSIPGESRTVPA